MMKRNNVSSILGLGLAGLIFAIGASAAETGDFDPVLPPGTMRS